MPDFRLLLLLPALFAGLAHGRAAPPSCATGAKASGWCADPVPKKSPAWRGTCFFPSNVEALDADLRGVARQQTLEAMKSQWLGQKGALVQFDAGVVEGAEIALWSRPDQTERVALKNLEFCRDVMANGADTGAWGTWLKNLPARLREGQCLKPLDYAFVQYVRLDSAWQDPVSMCEGDHVAIRVTTNDRFRLRKGGKWMDANGDPDDPASGAKLPCDSADCLRGQLIGLFVTEAGVESIFPIGASKDFRAPTHGTFSFMINDDSFEDNVWYSSGTVVDHAAITVTPID